MAGSGSVSKYMIFSILNEIDRLTNFFSLQVSAHLIQKVIFTDIDGTIVDIETGGYGETPKLIRSLVRSGIPVILCSAKTLTEQIQVRKYIGLDDPFIVENGGAIIIRRDYFDLSYIIDKYNVKVHGEDHIIELGKPAKQIRGILNDIRKKFKIDFKGVGDTSIEELSNITKLSAEQAIGMANREYGETILQIKKQDLARFTRLCLKMGLNLIHGGRFFDVTMGNDKGKAVEILINLFKKKYDYDVTFFGIGDSENDASMLELVGHPILVQRQDGSWSNIRGKEILRIPGIGPRGWALAYDIISGES
ncbi:MAG: HAD-IIB family hydrolase [Nitrososphaeraceae archaeon]